MNHTFEFSTSGFDVDYDFPLIRKDDQEIVGSNGVLVGCPGELKNCADGLEVNKMLEYEFLACPANLFSDPAGSLEFIACQAPCRLAPS